MLYKIPSVNFPTLEKKIEKLNSKSKVDLEPLSLKIVDTIKKKRCSRVGFEYEETIYEVELEGESPTLEGWTLVAVIQPLKEDNLIREVPGEICPPKYRTIDNICDHCGKKRKRNSVYLLRNESGEHKIVGRSCLSDFIGRTNPESLLLAAEWIVKGVKALDSSQEDQEVGDSSVRIEEFLAVTSVLIRKKGWLPKSKAFNEQSTAEIAWALCAFDDIYVADYVRDNDIVVEDTDIELATDALNWGKAIDEKNAPSNYLHNLGVACRQHSVTKRRAGYVASVVNAYSRTLDVAEKPNSDFVGVVGSRDVFEDLEVINVRAIDSVYGEKHLIRFHDSEGNEIVWWASRSLPDWAKKGNKVTVKGTVVKHEEYNDTKQTTVNRVVEHEN